MYQTDDKGTYRELTFTETTNKEVKSLGGVGRRKSDSL